MAYATSAEYTDYSGRAAPSDISRLLERASDTIDAAVVASYATDAAGNPTDPDVIAALRKATCAQVEWWDESGDEVGVLGDFTSVGIGSLNLSRGQQASKGRRLAPRASDHLQTAGLLNRSLGNLQTTADTFFDNR